MYDYACVSMSYGGPSLSKTTFSGLRSRYKTSRLCKYSIARITSET